MKTKAQIEALAMVIDRLFVARPASGGSREDEIRRRKAIDQAKRIARGLTVRDLWALPWSTSHRLRQLSEGTADEGTADR